MKSEPIGRRRAVVEESPTNVVKTKTPAEPRSPPERDFCLMRQAVRIPVRLSAKASRKSQNQARSEFTNSLKHSRQNRCRTRVIHAELHRLAGTVPGPRYA